MVARLFVALGVLGALAAAAAYNLIGVGTRVGFAENPYAQWSLPVLGVLLVAAQGLVSARWWGRWLSLAVGLAGTSLAVWSLGLAWWVRDGGSLVHPPGIAVTLLSPLLLLSLTGRAAFEYFDEAAAVGGSRASGRDAVVRWAVIANTAGIGALLFENLLFVRELGASGRASSWSVAFSLLALATMITGTLLVAWRKTVGLLIALTAAWMLLLSLGPLVLGGPSLATLVLLSAVAPGILLTFLAVALYARPAVRFLRGG
jgi:hypothetical protein